MYSVTAGVDICLFCLAYHDNKRRRPTSGGSAQSIRLTPHP